MAVFDYDQIFPISKLVGGWTNALAIMAAADGGKTPSVWSQQWWVRRNGMPSKHETALRRYCEVHRLQCQTSDFKAQDLVVEPVKDRNG